MDVKSTTLGKRKLQEHPDAELNSLKQKLKQARTDPQKILQIANKVLDEYMHDRILNIWIMNFFKYDGLINVKHGIQNVAILCLRINSDLISQLITRTYLYA